MKVSKGAKCPGGYMMAPQNYSVNDGEGIRTVLFFAKCPLRCCWCANPESFIENDKNDYVRYYGVDEIETLIDKQKVFYRQSGGGVTFSGGEASLQLDLLDYLSEKFYDDGLNLVLETSGYFDFEGVKHILNRMDLIFVDIKSMDTILHKKFTGCDNHLILENIKKMGKTLKNIVVRIPVIEGVNATENNIRETTAFVKKYIKKPKIELLPYHTLGAYKYEKLGVDLEGYEFATPSIKAMSRLKSIVENEGVEVVSYK